MGATTPTLRNDLLFIRQEIESRTAPNASREFQGIAPSLQVVGRRCAAALIWAPPIVLVLVLVLAFIDRVSSILGPPSAHLTLLTI
jgi:hypothetical protein